MGNLAILGGTLLFFSCPGSQEINISLGHGTLLFFSRNVVAGNNNISDRKIIVEIDTVPEHCLSLF